MLPRTKKSTAVFDSEGKLKLPNPETRWVFVGAPLTPNGLNNGAAPFPEYHHVFIEAAEGTMIVKELTRVLDPEFPDGSRKEPSGRGFFNGQYNGIDVTVKDSRPVCQHQWKGLFHLRASSLAIRWVG